MKNSFLALALMLSFGAFAQTYPYDPNPERDLCYSFIVYSCDENGEPIKDSTNPRYTEHRVGLRPKIGETGTSIMERARKVQEKYCEEVAEFGSGFIPSECSL